MNKILTLAGIFFAVPAMACSLQHGGEVNDCWYVTAASGAGEQNTVYSSGGTMALRSARCVHPSSRWRFHGAHIEHTKNIDDGGNALLWSAYSTYPRVAAYLEKVGALNRVEFTVLSGSDLNKLGVPLCRGLTSTR